MCLSDKYILRLTNTVVGNEAARLNANKNGVFITVPNYLVGKGKCNIKVNIPKLGYNNENNGQPNILGTAVIDADTVNAVKIDSSSSYEFTCPQLPQEIFLERMCYNITGSFNLVPAVSYTTAAVPFQVDLEIEFFEDKMDNK